MGGEGRAVDPGVLLGVDGRADGLALTRRALVIGVDADFVIAALGDVVILAAAKNIAKVVFKNLAQMVPVGVGQLVELEEVEADNKLGIFVGQRNILNLVDQVIHDIDLLVQIIPLFVDAGLGGF